MGYNAESLKILDKYGLNPKGNSAPAQSAGGSFNAESQKILDKYGLNPNRQTAKTPALDGASLLLGVPGSAERERRRREAEEERERQRQAEEQQKQQEEKAKPAPEPEKPAARKSGTAAKGNAEVMQMLTGAWDKLSGNYSGRKDQLHGYMDEAEASGEGRLKGVGRFLTQMDKEAEAERRAKREFARDNGFASEQDFDDAYELYSASELDRKMGYNPMDPGSSYIMASDKIHDRKKKELDDAVREEEEAGKEWRLARDNPEKFLQQFWDAHPEWGTAEEAQAVSRDFYDRKTQEALREAEERYKKATANLEKAKAATAGGDYSSYWGRSADDYNAARTAVRGLADTREAGGTSMDYANQAYQTRDEAEANYREALTNYRSAEENLYELSMEEEQEAQRYQDYVRNPEQGFATGDGRVLKDPEEIHRYREQKREERGQLRRQMTEKSERELNTADMALQAAAKKYRQASSVAGYAKQYEYEDIEKLADYEESEAAGKKRLAELEREVKEQRAGRAENVRSGNTEVAGLSEDELAAEDFYTYRMPRGNWNDKERNIYTYWLGKDEQKAFEYAADLNKEKFLAQRYENQQKISGWSHDNSGAGAVAGTLSRVATSPTALWDYMGDVAQYANTGLVMPRGELSPRDYANALAEGAASRFNEYGTISDDVAVFGGKGLGDLYQLGNSIAESMAWVGLGRGAEALGATKKLSFALINMGFFGTAASETTQQALARGATPQQALVIGAAAGAAEAIGESFSIDRLIHMETPVGARQIMMSVLKQAGIEGSEEGVTTLVNTLADAIVYGDKSELEQAYLNYLAQGMSADEAKNKAWSEWAEKLAFDVFGGVISGGVSSGAHIGINNALQSWSQQNGQQTTPQEERTAPPRVKVRPHAENRTGATEEQTTPVTPTEEQTRPVAPPAPAQTQATPAAPAETQDQAQPLTPAQQERANREARRAEMDAHDNGHRAFGKLAGQVRYAGLKAAEKYGLWGRDGVYDYAEMVARELGGIWEVRRGSGGDILRVNGLDAQNAKAAQAFEQMNPEAARDIRAAIEAQYGEELRAAAQQDAQAQNAEETPPPATRAQEDAGAPVENRNTDTAEQPAEAPTEAPAVLNSEERTSAEDALLNPTPRPKVKVRPHQNTTAPSQQNIDSTAPAAYNNTEGNGGITNDQGRSAEEAGRGVAAGEGRLGAQYQPGDRTGRGPGDPGIVRVDSELQKAYEKGGVVDYGLQDSSGDSAAYSSALEEGRNSDQKHGWMVTPQTAEELQGKKLRLSPDRSEGYVLTNDGDIEGVFKNKNTGKPGALMRLLPQAVAEGGTKLDCYGESLVFNYAPYGFIPVARVEFNEKYANPGWDPSKGRPYVYIMMHDGSTPSQMVENHNNENYHKWTMEELEALPTYDKNSYDDAIAYRDSLIEQKKNGQQTGTPAQTQGQNAGETQGQTEGQESESAEDMLLNPEETPARPRKVKPRQHAQDNYTDADRQAADELYEDLGQQYGTIREGENAARESNVPQQTEKGDRVGRHVRTIYEAQATPESRLPDIRAAVVEGEVSHIPVENQDRAKKALATIKRKGWEAAFRDWTAEVRSGKTSADLVAMGAVLWNNAANSDMSSHDLVDLLVDYENVASRAGSALSATRILKTLTPESKMYMVQKTVSNMNQERSEANAKRGRKKAERAQRKGKKEGASQKGRTEGETEQTRPAEDTEQTTPAEDTEQTAPVEETERTKPAEGAEETERTRPAEGRSGTEEQEGRRGITNSDNIPVSQWADKAGESVADELGKKLKAEAEGRISEKKIKTMCQIAEADVKKILRSYGTQHQNMDARALENILTNPGFYNTLYESLRGSLETKAGMSAEEIAELGHEWIDKPLADMLAEQAAQQSDIHVNDELVQAYLKVGELRNEDGSRLSAELQDELRDKYMDLILRDIASQVPSTINEKIRAIRYLNMLGNFKTQGRNILSNAAMLVTREAKDKTKALIELALSGVTNGRYERTTSLYIPPAMLTEAARDFKNVRDVALGEGKYEDGPSDRVRRKINDYKRVFKPSGEWGTDKATGTFSSSEYAKKLRKVVDAAEWLPEGYRIAVKWAMEEGDVIFSRANYASALAGYLRAHNVNSISEASPELLDRARNYAIRQAQEATFRDPSSFSQWVSGLGRNAPKLVRVATEGALAFRRTPANVFLRAYEYSPLGVLTAFKQIYDIVTQNGNSSAQDLVETLSKSFTGTGLFLLGALLHKRGLLRTKDEDKKLEEFQKQQGAQDWSLDLGDGRSFTLDWLAPDSMPLFMGAVFDQVYGDEDLTGNDALKLIGSMTEPLMEMSMMSGLNDSLESATGYGATLGPIPQFLLNSNLNWIGQLSTNSLMRQAAQASEKNRRTYWTDENSKMPEIVQKQIAQISAGVPGGGYHRMDYVDGWGRKQDKGSAGERILQSFFSPGYSGKDRSTPYDKEIERLYKDGYKSVIPQAPDREDSWKTDSGTITVPNEDYEEYAVSVGQKKLELIGDFMDSEEYKGLDDDTRADIIQNLYQFATWQARNEYAAMHGDAMTKTSTDKSMGQLLDIEDAGINIPDYLIGKKQANEDGQGALKNQEVYDWLVGSDYTEDQKAAIWEADKASQTKSDWQEFYEKNPMTILTEGGIPEDQARDIVDRLGVNNESSSRMEQLVEANKLHIKPDVWADAYEKHKEINNLKGLSASEKYMKFAQYLDGVSGISKRQKEILQGQMTFRTSMAVNMETFDALSGKLGTDKATGLVEKFSALEPLPGKSTVSKEQKIDVVLAENLSEQEKMDALQVIMDEKEYGKLTSVTRTGVPATGYLQGRKKADADSDGILRNQEVYNWLLNSGYTEAQKKAVWEANKGSSTKDWATYYGSNPVTYLMNAGLNSRDAVRTMQAINTDNDSELTQKELYAYYLAHPEAKDLIREYWNNQRKFSTPFEKYKYKG